MEERTHLSNKFPALLLAIGLIWIAPLSGQDADAQKVERLAAECEAGNLKSCLKLEKLARKWDDREHSLLIKAVRRMKNKVKLDELARNTRNSGDIRLAAICNPNLADQALIAQIIISMPPHAVDLTYSCDETLKTRLTDQALIAKVAKNAKSDDVRESALRKLTDQLLLADIAKNDEDWDVREAAVQRLDNQTDLADIARTDYWHGVREAAVSRIEDIDVLADIAGNDKEYSVRHQAAIRRSLLVEMSKPDAHHHADPEVRLASVEKLTDQALLADIAINDNHYSVRRAAVRKLVELTLAAEIARHDDHWEVRETALQKLTDQSVIIEIAKNDKVSNVRKAAVEKITDQAALSEIAKTDQNTDVRKDAVKKLDDQAALTGIAKTDKGWPVREAAVLKLTDPRILAEIARNDCDNFVRKAAAANLHLMDQEVFAEIAKYDRDSAVRNAAIERLTARTYREIEPWIRGDGIRYMYQRQLLEKIVMTSGNPYIVIEAAHNEHLTKDMALSREISSIRIEILDYSKEKDTAELEALLHDLLKTSGIEVAPHMSDAAGIFKVIVARAGRGSSSTTISMGQTYYRKDGGLFYGDYVIEGAALLTFKGRLAYASAFKTDSDSKALANIVSELKTFLATR